LYEQPLHGEIITWAVPQKFHEFWEPLFFCEDKKGGCPKGIPLGAGLL